MRLRPAQSSWITPYTGDGDDNDNDDDKDDIDYNDNDNDDDGVILMVRISYCSADATFDHVFAFIATNRYVVVFA